MSSSTAKIGRGQYVTLSILIEDQPLDPAVEDDVAVAEEELRAGSRYVTVTSRWVDTVAYYADGPLTNDRDLETLDRVERRFR